MDDVFILNESGTDAARSGLLRLHDAVGRRESGRPEAALSPEELLARFRVADPTRNAACLPWLLRTYAAGGYRLEDLSKAHNTLAEFARLRGLLPNTSTIDGETRNPRKLGSHTTLASLWSVIAPLVEAERLAQEDCSGEQVDTDRERALSQSRVIHRSNRMVVAVPMTEEASCWWGQGTQWCTAARNNNAFEQYHKDAPLIVVCLRKIGDLPARKLQLYVHTGDMQFMDENDAPVSPELILERWQDLEALLHWAVGGNGAALDFIPRHLRTEAICLAAVNSGGWSLYYVPENLRTEAICAAAVNEYGPALEYVPESLRTEAMCTAAIGNNGGMLYYVPEHLRTEEICLVAVEQNGMVLDYVPEHLRTEAICTTALEQNGRALELVPEPLRTEVICLVAVVQDGLALEYVPEPLRTEAICTAAVTQCGRALQYVPEPLRTEAICTAAVGNNGRALQFVPKPLRTEAICTAAVGNNGLALEFIPEPLRTEAVYLTAVSNNGDALYYVPEPLRTEVICTAAVKENGRAIEFTPEPLRTEAICMSAVSRHGMALYYVPEPLRTEAICTIAVGMNRAALQYVPENLRVKIIRLATETHDEHKTVSDETNMPEAHNLILVGLEDYLKNLLPIQQDTYSSNKLGK